MILPWLLKTEYQQRKTKLNKFYHFVNWNDLWLTELLVKQWISEVKHFYLRYILNKN